VLILFDQGTPVGIAKFLRGHTVRTAGQQGWGTLLNGDLLRMAEAAGFDLFLTTDKNLVHQQNLSKYKIAIVVLGASRWSLIQPAMQQIVSTVNAAVAGTYTLLEIADR
jgi:hypothetical protein